ACAGRAGVCCATTVLTQSQTPTRSRGLVAVRGGSALHRAGAGCQVGFPGDQHECARGGRHMCAPGWVAPGYRTGRCSHQAFLIVYLALPASAGALHSLGGSTLPARHAADVASNNRLELRTAHTRGATTLPALRRLCGWLYLGSRRTGVR